MAIKKTQNAEHRALFETVARMDEKIQQMSDDIRDLKENIPNWSKTNFVLFGAEGKGGLVQEVRDIKQNVGELKEWKVALTAKIAVISAIVGGGFSYLMKFLLGG